MKGLICMLFLFIWFTCSSGFYVQPEVVKFTGSPESATVCKGCRVELNCAIPKQMTSADLPDPKIQWLINGSEVSRYIPTSNETHIFSEVIIESAMSADTGWYSCLASDGSDDDYCRYVLHPCISTITTSNHAWIQVIDNVTTSEVIQVSMFSSLMLECGSQLVQSIHKPLQIVWQRNGTEINNSSNEVVISNGNLMVYTDNHTQFSTLYDCLVVFESATIHYQSYNLLISQPQDNETTRSHVSSTHRMAYNGSMVELTCSVRNGEGIQPLNVSWMKHTSISSRTLSSYNLRGHLLILEEAQLDDSGTYCCWVDNVQEDCIEISIVEQDYSSETSSSPPLQHFINFRENGTHYVNLTCPQPHVNSTIWFHNGNKLTNSTERNLLISSTDPAVLYGIYQCSVGAFESDRILTVVSRVMPYGIANPPGEIQEQELAWADAIYTVMRIQWKAPRYTGNISNHSFSYRIDLQGVEYSRETSYVAYLSPYSFVRLRISLYNNLYGNLSNLTAHQFRVQSYCQFKVLFPPILSLSCDMGRPSVSWMFNDMVNKPFQVFSITDPNMRVTYLRGRCLDNNENVVYEVENSYYIDDSTFHNGMVLKLGTQCQFSAANSVTHSSNEDFAFCYNRMNLQYSSTSCNVNASVNFVANEFAVDESAGVVEVCVRAYGYYFSVNITITSLTTSESDYNDVSIFQMDFLSPDTNVSCVNITINDDSILESNESVELEMTSDYPVLLQRAFSTIVIMDDDNVSVGFQPSHLNLTESDETVLVCVVLEGVLERNVSATPVITAIDGTIELLEAVTFTPGSDNTQCFDVEVEPSDDDILKENERLTLSLTSNDTSVFTSFAVIEIQDNDNVTMQFTADVYSVSEADGEVEVCIVMRGMLEKNLTVMITALNETAIVQSDFLIVEGTMRIFFNKFTETIQCYNITIINDDAKENLEQFRLTLSSEDPNVMMSSDAVVVIDDDDRADGGSGSGSGGEFGGEFGDEVEDLKWMSSVLGAIIILLIVLLIVVGIVVLRFVHINRKESFNSFVESWRDYHKEILSDSKDPVSVHKKPYYNIDDYDMMDSVSVIVSLEYQPDTKARKSTDDVFEAVSTPNQTSNSTIALESTPTIHFSPTLLEKMRKTSNSSEDSIGYINIHDVDKKDSSLFPIQDTTDNFQMELMHALESELSSPLHNNSLFSSPLDLKTNSLDELDLRLSVQERSASNSPLHINEYSPKHATDVVGEQDKECGLDSIEVIKINASESASLVQTSASLHLSQDDSGFVHDSGGVMQGDSGITQEPEIIIQGDSGGYPMMDTGLMDSNINIKDSAVSNSGIDSGFKNDHSAID